MRTRVSFVSCCYGRRGLLPTHIFEDISICGSQILHTHTYNFTARCYPAQTLQEEAIFDRFNITGSISCPAQTLVLQDRHAVLVLSSSSITPWVTTVELSFL